jgi:hypothetical protein
MTKQIALTVSPREVIGKATKQLRAKGILPANIIGQGMNPRAFNYRPQILSVSWMGIKQVVSLR